MVEYKHSLSKGLVRTFVRAVKRAAPASRFSFSDCGKLSYSQAANLQKLRYWELIVKAETDKERGGDWIITERGFDFLTGRITLHPKVWTYRGVVTKFEGEKKSIQDITGGWKYRIDYAREAEPHNPFCLT